MARRRNPGYMSPQELYLWKRQISQTDRHHDRAFTDRDRAERELEDAYDAADKRLRRAQDDAHAAAAKKSKEYAAKEKDILSAPRYTVRGATVGQPELWVTHAKAEMPSLLATKLGVGRRSAHRLLRLRPGGGLGPGDAAPEVLSQAMPHLLSDEYFEAWIEALNPLLSDTRKRYPILAKLRDDDWMVKLLDTAGVLPPPETRTHSRRGTYGTYPYTLSVVNVPTLTEVRIERTGLVLTFAHTPGMTAKTWNSRHDRLQTELAAAGLMTDDLTIAPATGGGVALYLNDRDPFADLPQGTVTPFDAEHFRSLLGIDSRGHEVFIDWANNSGMVVGGVPGSGKTASLLPVFAGMAGQAELHVIDGKAAHDLDVLKPIATTYDRSADYASALETLRRVSATATRRADAIYQATGEANFWNLDVKTRERMGLYPVFILIDESPRFLDGRGKVKEEKETCAAIAATVREMVLQRRSAGVVVVLVAQKPDAQNTPTDLRDNAAMKLAFKASTLEQAVTILGAQDPDAPNPTRIPMGAKGRFVMEADGRGLTLGQAPYVPAAEIAKALESATPVLDQAEVARQLSGGREPEPPAGETVPGQPDDRLVMTELSDEELAAELARRRAARNGDVTAEEDDEEEFRL